MPLITRLYGQIISSSISTSTMYLYANRKRRSFMINMYIIKDYVAIIKDKEIKFTTATNSSRALSKIYKVNGPVLLDQKT